MWIKYFRGVKKILNSSWWLVILLCVASSGYGQIDPSKSNPSVKMIGKALPNSIVLRWGPDRAVAWQLANKYGYYLDRYTIMRDGELLSTPEVKKLYNTPQKPWILDRWEPITENNDYALIAAQAIYGDSFELTENYSTDIVSVINQTKEIEQRFSFALFSADMSPPVAKASALAYTDTDIKDNEKYVYKVYTDVPATIQAIDTGFVYVGLEDFRPLPKPVKLKADFEDKKVLLSWNRMYYDNIYVAYSVERSDDDGKTFQTITNLPIINTESPSGKNSRLMFRGDSLTENYKTYHYRVKGLSAFGETGPASDEVNGFGFELLKEAPAITEGEVIDNEKIMLKWEFSEAQSSKMTGFTLTRALKGNGEYKIVAKDLAPDIREYVDETPETTNYYKLTVKDPYGQEKTSFPYFAQLIDSIPPIAPVDLIGVIDTSGLVTIRWTPNSEKDLLGYRVFRSNFKSEELSEVTVDPVADTVFSETINIKTLTETVYYKVRAVDTHYNPSIYSVLLSLDRPDVMPPVPPVFKQVNSTTDGISLSWVNSTSTDVKNHLLYRRKLGDKGWKLLAVFNKEKMDTSYVDQTVGDKSYYEYTLLAIDDDKLESAPSAMVRTKRIDTGLRPMMDQVFAKVERDKKQITLAWDYTPSGVEKFIIFKAIEEDPIRIYKSLTGESNQFIDQSLVVNTKYYYRIQAVYQDGGQSPLSKKIEVKY